MQHLVMYQDIAGDYPDGGYSVGVPKPVAGFETQAEAEAYIQGFRYGAGETHDHLWVVQRSAWLKFRGGVNMSPRIEVTAEEVGEYYGEEARAKFEAARSW